eukprot:122857-Chlamydomonas_euryale.AAC.7
MRVAHIKHARHVQYAAIACPRKHSCGDAACVHMCGASKHRRHADVSAAHVHAERASVIEATRATAPRAAAGAPAQVHIGRDRRGRVVQPDRRAVHAGVPRKCGPSGGQ